MSNPAKPEGDVWPDDQLQRELQLLIQRHAEFSRRLESILSEIQETHLPHLQEPLSPSLNTESGAAEIARLNDRLSRLSVRLSSFETHLDATNNQIKTNTARLDDILESRTWRLMTGAGGVLLRLLGRR